MHIQRSVRNTVGPGGSHIGQQIGTGRICRRLVGGQEGAALQDSHST
jgi:hypothetical protein